MPLRRSPGKGRVGTRSNPGELTDMETEQLKKQLEEISIEAAKARSENENLRNQLDILIKQNESLLAQREEAESRNIQNNINRKENGTQTREQVNRDNCDPRIENVISPAASSNMTNQTNDLNTELMHGIINHFETLKININIPTYKGDKGNPAEFIEKIEKYFLRKRISDDHYKLLISEEALKDRARAWYESQTHFIDFAHFKIKFLKNFYSLEARAETKNRWSTRKHQFSDGTFSEYFVEQRRVAKYFDPPMDSYETNYYIIKQLPPRAREILSVVNYSDTELILKALGRLDSSRKENFDNKKVGETNIRGSAPGYRAPTQQAFHGSAVNCIQGENRGRSFRLTRDHERSSQQMDNIPRKGINENWRDRTLVNFSLPDTSRPPPNRVEEQITQNIRSPKKNENVSVTVIRALQRSEFIKDLCWDVEGNEGSAEVEGNSPIISPGVRVEIFSQSHEMLIDSGSEVTCISEAAYTIFKKDNKFPELPVSNLAVYVAVGRKTVKIARKVYLNVKIWKFQINYSFLVVTGLSTDLIMGADFLRTYGGIINFQNETFKLMGELIPKEFITYRSIVDRENNIGSGFYGLKICMQQCVQNKDIQVKKSDVGGENKEYLNYDKNSCNGIVTDSLMNAAHESLFNKIESYDEKLKHLNENERKQVKKLLYHHKDVFSEEPGCTHVYEHEIRVIVQKPFVRKSYPVPLQQQPAVDKEIEKMLRQGIIQRSCSEFCNPIRVVKKKNGEVRVCLDARWLNKIIADDNEAPPRIEELLQKYEGATYFSTTDLTKGYWQVKLASESRKFTAFHYKNEMYEFNRVPFGLKTAGPGFIRALSRALHGVSHFATAYVDDILITSKTFTEHIEHLNFLFEVLRKAGSN